MYNDVYHPLIGYVCWYTYEQPTKSYVQVNAMHKLGSSPIGDESFVQTPKGQGEAKTNLVLQ